MILIVSSIKEAIEGISIKELSKYSKSDFMILKMPNSLTILTSFNPSCGLQMDSFFYYNIY